MRLVFSIYDIADLRNRNDFYIWISRLVLALFHASGYSGIVGVSAEDMKAGNGAQRSDRINPSNPVAPLRCAPGFHCSYVYATIVHRWFRQALIENMKAVLDIKDSKAPFVLELLGNFSFVKVQPITHEKALLLREIKEAVDTVNMIKKGKKQARFAKELLHEI